MVKNATFVKSYADPALVPKDGLPQVAMLGRSNAGKSSLINSITGVDGLAKTSAAPGRTRLINVFNIDKQYELVDLPGYGYAKASKNERDRLLDLLSGFLSSAVRLKLVVVILDSRLGATTVDNEVIEQVQRSGLPLLLVANKADKPSRMELRQIIQSIERTYPNVPVVAHSTVSGDGRGLLLDAFTTAIRKD
ncbi:ribosome biogenesis GTP-binding protein YihA/YsxC [Candidatus Uhrbacteria bacterium]|nr:ribosome biogenesis GTP-binding protein YihA/YsxC [Candidatus Uhrbacteria bacterium]